MAVAPGSCFQPPADGAVSEEALDVRSALSGRDFARVDDYADAAPSTARRSIKSLSAYLCGTDSPCRDDLDRARALFRWVATHVEYDAAGYFGTAPKCSNNPGDVLSSGKSVCEGYASLYLALARQAGLECEKLAGHSKGFSFKPGEEFRSNHAWNA